MKRSIFVLAAVAVGAVALPVHAGSLNWDAFVIRNATVSGDVPAITEHSDGDGVTTTIDEGGEKTGYGTTGVDGLTIGDLVQLNYIRNDTGSSTPYVNIWVTDGSNTALIAPVTGATPAGNYTGENVDGVNLQPLGFNIYDNSAGSNYDWLAPGAVRVNQLLVDAGNVVTLADIANLQIFAGASTTDSGASKNGDGFNIVFGDTQGNFNQPIPYDIDQVTLSTTVPLPASAWSGLALLGGLGLFGAVKRRSRQTA